MPAGGLVAGWVLGVAGYFGLATASMAAVTLLGGPWVLGLWQRMAARQRVERERAEEAEWARQRALQAELAALEAQRQAEEEESKMARLATLEAANARLARDVHDVVGHSLAVILAQAEAANYQAEPEALQQSMTNIAGSARRSLGEIREVLAAARGETGPSNPRGGLDALLDSLTASGVELEVTQMGTRRALPPELETVAYRVLQEMLTNAMRHGQLGEPIAVSLLWADRLTMEVRNLDGEHTAGGSLRGGGIPGMTSRLAGVGGTFELHRHQGADGDVVTATAELPLRVN